MNTRTLPIRQLSPLSTVSLRAARRPLQDLTRSLAQALARAGRGLWAALEAYGQRRAARELEFTASWMPDDQRAIARVLREQAAEWRAR